MYYAALGMPVLPLHTPTLEANNLCSCHKPTCKDIGKHPRISDWPNKATTDPAVIQGWYQKWPDANVGLVTGSRSGFFVLDVDPRNNGDHTLDELVLAHGLLPVTAQSFTGGGGLHFFFAWPTDRVVRCKNGLLPGLDIKGEGGYVVAPPSLHESGKRYEWEISAFEEVAP